MTAVEKARAAYIDSVKDCDEARHRLIVRAKKLAAAVAEYKKKKTAKRRAAVREARKIRNARYRSYKRAQVRKHRLKAVYLARKSLASKPLRLRALHYALKDVGVTERGGNNRGTDVERIIREGGGSAGDAWCLWAVIAWYKRAGSKLNWSATYGAVRLIKNVCKRVVGALAGHVIEYTFEHTGLLIYFCNANGSRRPRLLATHIKAVEGNTGDVGAVSDSQTGGDGVKVKIRPKTYVANFYKAPR